MAMHSIRFGLFLIFSAALYIGAVVVNVVAVNSITSHGELWLLPCLGLLLLPSVILQLVSAVLLLMDKGDNLSVTASVGIGLLHIFQLGFLWRHVMLFRDVELESNSRARGHIHLRYLQLVFTFTTLLPLLLIQTFIVIHNGVIDRIIIVAMATTFAGTCWFLASFRIIKRQNEYEIPSHTLPGKICRLLWRGGEISSRIISLALYTSAYYYWIFLVLGLHGLTMLVCLYTTVLGMSDKPGALKSCKVLVVLLLAYMYSFCFINQSSENTTFRYTFYYTVMFLENAVMTIVWYLHTDDYISMFDKNTLVLISSCTFFIGMISLMLYHKCFCSDALYDSEKEHIYETDDCINCKLSLCSKHSMKMQRPFSAGYITQYQNALANGYYYKNILQDNFMDTDGECGSGFLDSSGEHWQIRDTDLESMRTIQKKQYTSVQSSGTYTHKRFFDSDSSIAKMTDTDSITSGSGSGVYEEDWRHKSDTILSQLSAMDALSLVSSRTHLLTDSWDNLIHQNKTVSGDHKQAMKIDILNSLIRKGNDTNFVSDGYMTDHTLDSYQLPITVLAKKRLFNRRKIEPAYSTASDSTDCTICAFMRQHPSSPEESRRNFQVYDKIPEETLQLKATKKKRRDYSTLKSANKHRKPVPVHRSSGTRDPEKTNQHKYEKASVRQRRRDMIRIMDSTSNTVNTFNMPHARQNNHTIKSIRYSPSVIDTSVDEIQEHPKRQSGDSSVLAMRIDSRGACPSFSDSDDSAFPRNTPVSDWSDAANKYKTTNTGFSVASNCHQIDSVISDLCRNTQITDSGKIPGKITLSAYIAATDNDKDGTSESSCEMII